jgi:hypothetical protein
MSPAQFFSKRLLHDVVGDYYAHPTGRSEIGFGGPWEASEARPGREGEAYRDNLALARAATSRVRHESRAVESGAGSSSDADSTARMQARVPAPAPVPTMTKSTGSSSE